LVSFILWLKWLRFNSSSQLALGTTADASAAFWLLFMHTIGVRVSEEEKKMNLDKAERGMKAYPKFGRGFYMV